MDGTTLARSLPVGYQRLLDRCIRVLSADDRVRAMWVGGSLARGTADAASDLDILLAVDDDSFEDFVERWHDWLDVITPTVLAKRLPFGDAIFTTVTPNFERLDLVAEAVSALSNSPHRHRLVVFDRDELTKEVPKPEPTPGPSRDTIANLVQEFFRVSAIETIVVRDDWLLAREHVHVLHSLIYRLFVEANAPLPPMGVKQWTARLKPRQAEALRRLPTDATSIHELRVAHIALARLFLSNAQPLADRLGVDWPTELEAAAAAHVATTLGLDEPYPRDPTCCHVAPK